MSAMMEWRLKPGINTGTHCSSGTNRKRKYTWVRDTFPDLSVKARSGSGLMLLPGQYRWNLPVIEVLGEGNWIWPLKKANVFRSSYIQKKRFASIGNYCCFLKSNIKLQKYCLDINTLKISSSMWADFLKQPRALWGYASRDELKMVH